MRVFLPRRFENPAIGYGLFFVDIAILTVVLYSLYGTSPSWLLLFYLTILMATLGENVSKSVAIGFGVSAFYVGFLEDSGRHLLV